MVLDGELVAVSDAGDVDFYRLGQRMRMRRPTRHAHAVRVRPAVARRTRLHAIALPRPPTHPRDARAVRPACLFGWAGFHRSRAVGRPWSWPAVGERRVTAYSTVHIHGPAESPEP